MAYSAASVRGLPGMTRGPAPGLLAAGTRHARAAPRGRTQLRVAASQLTVRPYTVRKGDTLSSICRKRDLVMEEVAQLNPGLNPDLIVAGKTILLPAGKLSERDKEILSGIQTGSFRHYPVREGESLEDIMDRRGITMAEMELLNPDVDLARVKANQVLRLPCNKYTVREQEMLTGSGIVPKEFFSTSSTVPSLVCGAVLGAAGAYWYFKDKAEKAGKKEGGEE
mmetsp:Transcript_20/g.47  ORF Transcript_20/g.47 Transcript_20/m.47 type:complete len:224 (+) Transcript_20:94-765(+)